MACEHPYIAIQPDLLADEQGSRPIALCLNPECQLHVMALRLIDKSYVEDIRAIAAREWADYQAKR